MKKEEIENIEAEASTETRAAEALETAKAVAAAAAEGKEWYFYL